MYYNITNLVIVYLTTGYRVGYTGSTYEQNEAHYINPDKAAGVCCTGQCTIIDCSWALGTHNDGSLSCPSTHAQCISGLRPSLISIS